MLKTAKKEENLKAAKKKIGYERTQNKGEAFLLAKKKKYNWEDLKATTLKLKEKWLSL